MCSQTTPCSIYFTSVDTKKSVIDGNGNGTRLPTMASNVFASPNRLRIRLKCTRGTPVRTHLSCWPALRIVIEYGDKATPNDEDNVIVALGHPD
ncbi:hypothetical protein EDB89DRAFT_2233250, partial [Lactarius sanguifluus]